MAKKTTGRFKTREELVERVAFLFNQGELSNEKMGESCGVSATTIAKIIDSDEGQAAIDAIVQKNLEASTAAKSQLVTEPPQTIPSESVIAYAPDSPFAKFEVAKRIAHTLAMSDLVPDAYRGRPNNCFVAINMGAELGMEPFQAIQSIAVIDGKPCLYGDGLIGVVRSSPLCMWIEESLSDDGKSATCRTQRKGDPNPITATYSMADAMLAGIDSKKNWKKHPKRMLQMRARAYCLRDAYPDILKGLGVVEEMVDHEDTPAEIQSFDLPEKKPDPVSTVFPNAKPMYTDDEGNDHEITLSLVERMMHQSDDMESLLKAGELAKHLSERDQGTARITYKKMRNALKEDHGT